LRSGTGCIPFLAEAVKSGGAVHGLIAARTWNYRTMTAKLSAEGQIALPEAALAELNLRPGARLDCLVRQGRIVLTLRAQPRRTARKARILKSKLTGLPAVVPPPGTPPLTPEAVHFVLADFP